MAKDRVEKQESPIPKRTKPKSSNHDGRGRGRTMIAIFLLGFVIIASVIIWRRTYVIAIGEEIHQLRAQVTQLQSERARLAGMIRDESSRSRLMNIVESRGMQLPADHQVRIISR